MQGYIAELMEPEQIEEVRELIAKWRPSES